MAIFRNERAECQCIDDATNHRIFWMDPETFGRVYVYLSPDDAIGAADQFNRYGILKEAEFPRKIDNPWIEVNRNQERNLMFFVRGLTSNGKAILVNPDQVLYVGSASSWRGKTALVLTHNKRLVVDQDTETVSQRFEDYLKDVGDTDNRDTFATREPGSGQTH